MLVKSFFFFSPLSICSNVMLISLILASPSSNNPHHNSLQGGLTTEGVTIKVILEFEF